MPQYPRGYGERLVSVFSSVQIRSAALYLYDNMTNNNNLDYKVGDIIFVSPDIYRIIGHKQCETCRFDILDTCRGQPTFENRRTGTQTTICALTKTFSNPTVRRSYEIVKVTNIRW